MSKIARLCCAVIGMRGNLPYAAAVGTKSARSIVQGWRNCTNASPILCRACMLPLGRRPSIVER
jgi:hypothetical protein